MSELQCPHCSIEIDEHPATSCLNDWVAVAVMGWDVAMQIVQMENGKYDMCRDIAAAWEVLGKFSKWALYAGGYVMLGDRNDGKEWKAHALKIPLAICRAAIKATA